MSSIDSFQARGSLTVSTSSGERTYEIFRIGAVTGSDRLPFSHKVLLENLQNRGWSQRHGRGDRCPRAVATGR